MIREARYTTSASRQTHLELHERPIGQKSDNLRLWMRSLQPALRTSVRLEGNDDLSIAVCRRNNSSIIMGLWKSDGSCGKRYTGAVGTDWKHIRPSGGSLEQSSSMLLQGFAILSLACGGDVRCTSTVCAQTPRITERRRLKRRDSLPSSSGRWVCFSGHG